MQDVPGKAAPAVPAKPKRRMKSFQADPDVADKLERMQGEGRLLSWVCNTAVRRYLAATRSRKPKGVA